ncbi:hypothetical protein ACYCEV_00455, partial [Aerococcus mictus]
IVSYTGEGFYLGMGDWLGKDKQMSKDYADAVVNRNFESNAFMVATGKVVDSGVINQLDDMQRLIDSADLSDNQIVVHNELVGDRIFTSVENIRGRKENKDKY